MTGDAELRELIEALSDPRAYPGSPSRVEVVQTHISAVFLAGDRAYKVKKPVDLGFLDFTTLELRRHFCEEELRLNRRLAPEIYLGVVPLVRDRTGRMRVGGEGEPVEWAVEMIRLPEERMLYAMLDRGEIDSGLVNRLADLLVRFHAEAATGREVDEFGRIEVIAGNARENFEQIFPFADPAGVRTLTPSLHAFLESSAGDFLRTRRRLLEERVRGGRIREGHGDLHARNICCTERGIVVYDCIEFNRRFRCADVACDLAFLAMDLDHRGFSGFSRQLVRRYADTAGDAELPELLDFYKAYRAVVRGKVAAMTAASSGTTPERRDELRLESMRYFHLAAAYDLPPSLVLLCGLPGTGKTWVALRVARPLRASVHQSDVRRKQIAGIPRTSRRREGFERGLYSAEMTERVYGSLREDAEAELRAGRTVIVDAAFPRRGQRAAFAEAARRAGRPLWILHVQAPEPVARERLERRQADANEVSDADFGVYLQARESFEPPAEGEGDGVVNVASGAMSGEDVAEALLEKMISRVRAAR